MIPDVPAFPWPDAARCAFTIGVHLDAETLWTSLDPANEHRPVALSQGRFGVTRGVAALLELLREEDVPATFFVPGRVAEQHERVIAAILDAGHAVGHHGLAHERFRSPDETRERDALHTGLQALERVTGIRPRGFAAPGWDMTPNTLHIVAEMGLEYSTNMMDDVFPYVHPLDIGAWLLEIPVHWLLDDAPFRLAGPGLSRPLRSVADLTTIWLEEFRAIHESGGVFNLTLHPQISGRPSMVHGLRRLLATVKHDHEDVWFASCEAITDLVRSIDRTELA